MTRSALILVRKAISGCTIAAGLWWSLPASAQQVHAQQDHQHQTPSTTGQPLPKFSQATGTAPPVAQNVIAERIVNARSEPHNWLTYYGAYDGQRYSTLDQVNT